MVADGEFWQATARAATTVPASGAEEEAWIARNLCELALSLEVADAPVALLDEVVASRGLHRAPARFADRLRGLRARRGEVPEFYPTGLDAPPTDSGSEELLASARILLEFAEQLSQSHAPQPLRSARGGRGKDAVNARAAWRPFPEPARPATFIELDIPTELMWRAWAVLPGVGTVRVVNDEQLTDDDFDIWWGVHDGSHLDHLAMFPLDVPPPITFGSGLIATESLVMSLELLAAAEALVDENGGPQASVRAGILERVGRIGAVFTTADLRPVVDRLGLVRDLEFPAVPTIASAYVRGPIDLIRSGFTHPLVPEPVGDNLRRRWAAIEHAHPAISALLADARSRSPRD